MEFPPPPPPGVAHVSVDDSNEGNVINAEFTRLIAQLKSPEADTRAAAAEALCQAGDDAAAFAPPLVEAVKDEDRRVVQWANAALEGMGPPTADHAGTLARLLDDPSPDIAYWAATLLGRLGGRAAEDPAVVSALARCLMGHPAVSARERAAWALGQIGPAAQAALPALSQAQTAGGPRLTRLAQKAVDLIKHSKQDGKTASE